MFLVIKQGIIVLLFTLFTMGIATEEVTMTSSPTFPTFPDFMVLKKPSIPGINFDDLPKEWIDPSNLLTTTEISIEDISHGARIYTIIRGIAQMTETEINPFWILPNELLNTTLYPENMYTDEFLNTIRDVITDDGESPDTNETLSATERSNIGKVRNVRNAFRSLNRTGRVQSYETIKKRVLGSSKLGTQEKHFIMKAVDIFAKLQGSYPTSPTPEPSTLPTTTRRSRRRLRKFRNRKRTSPKRKHSNRWASRRHLLNVPLVTDVEGQVKNYRWGSEKKVLPGIVPELALMGLTNRIIGEINLDV